LHHFGHPKIPENSSITVSSGKNPYQNLGRHPEKSNVICDTEECVFEEMITGKMTLQTISFRASSMDPYQKSLKFCMEILFDIPQMKEFFGP
jgi:hypothetical protein